MPMTPDAAKQYKPRRTPGSLDEVIYPETRAKIKEAKTDIEDEKTRQKIKGMGYAKGGSASSRADGCATKGKTRGTMVKMSYGGKC
jgi:hypothetical protein